MRLRRPGDNVVSVAATGPGVSFRAIRLDREKLPIQMLAQTPFTAQVRAQTAGFLETPRVFLEGYTAVVNGKDTPVQRSPGSLVMVPVPAGESKVVVEYIGPSQLRLAWWVSLGCFAAWPWLVLGMSAYAPSGLARFASRCYRPACFIVAGALVIIAGVGAVRSIRQAHANYGSLRLEVKLATQPAYPKEPLLVVGRTGAADCVFLSYEPDNRVRVGFDHWSSGGPLSEPLEIDLTQTHTVEITCGGLYPPSRLFGRVALPHSPNRLVIKLDGKIVLDQPTPFHVAGADEVYLGRNPVGIGGVSSLFSGSILKAERFQVAPTAP
jgi:hypothetical protein